jgi:hypothetical protein
MNHALDGVFNLRFNPILHFIALLSDMNVHPFTQISGIEKDYDTANSENFRH